jgi:hypothetical protein
MPPRERRIFGIIHGVVAGRAIAATENEQEYNGENKVQNNSRKD